MSLRFDDLDSVVELYTEDDFWQLVVAAQTIPTFFGGLGEFVDHGESGLVGKTSPRSNRSMPDSRERALNRLLQAIAAAALVAPAQVAARLVEFLFLRRIHPVISARIAAVLHPIGAAALAIAGPSGAAVFAVLYGAGNGLLTIARGTVPLAIFGPYAYGERTGLLRAHAEITARHCVLGEIV